MGRGRRLTRHAIKVAAWLSVSALLVGIAGCTEFAIRWWSIERIEVPASQGPNGTWLILATDSREGLDFDNLAAFEESGPTGVDIVLYVTESPPRILVVPRELVVPGQTQRLTDLYDGSINVLVDAVCDGLGLGVENVVVVDFSSVAAVVNAAGGVTIHADHPLRDHASGATLEAGENHLDGEEAVAYARSRRAEIQVDGNWVPEPDGRLTRGLRASQLVDAVVDRVDPWVAHPIRLRRLLGAVTAHVRLSEGVSLGELRSLASVMSPPAATVLPDLQPSPHVLRSYPTDETHRVAHRYSDSGDRCR